MKQSRCINCMAIIDEDAVSCPHCGYGQNAEHSTFCIKPGTILKGRYLVGRILGQGGFGITYVGYDLTLDVKVAIKEYFPMGCATRNYTISNQIQWNTTQFSREQWQQGSESFLKEARRLAKLDSLPGIVRVKDTFPENQTSYIIMEYIEGETLKERLKKTGTMPMRECIALLTPLMESLAKMHEKGLIHRDISPDNIMIMPDGRACLLDFGAAKDVSFQQTVAASEQVAKKGFSPPEQYREKGKIGSWTDVYALCATIYYCVMGKLVPEAVDRLFEDTLDVAELKSCVGETDAAALADGLKMQIEERIQTVTELLGRFKKDVPLKTNSSVKPDASTAPAAAKKSKKKLVIAAAACVVLFLMIVGIFFGGEDTNKNTALFANTLMADSIDDAVNGVFYGTVLGSNVERNDIRSITFLDTLNETPDTAWDASWDQDGTVMAWMKQNADNEKYFDLFIGAEGGVRARDCYRLFAGYYNVETIIFQNCFDTSEVKNMNDMFCHCNNLAEIDTENLNTGKATDMSWMFSMCEKLAKLDVSGFDTSEVENMRNMFYGCKNLEALDVSGFDTKKVTNISSMFYECEKLTSLDVENFDTSQMTDIRWLFYNCKNLTRVDVSGFDMGNVENMKSMFCGCQNLEELDVSGFDTKKVTDMSYLFNDCEQLTVLDVGNFDTSQVTNMECMFQSCFNLKELDVSNFDTGKVTNMGWMFNQCKSLTSVDVSSFDTSLVGNMERMFQLCGSLEALDISNFNISDGTDRTDMFKDCSLTEKEVRLRLNKNVLMKEIAPQGTEDASLSEKYDLDVKTIFLGTVLGSDISRDSIASVTFLDTTGEMPDTAWDVSMDQDGTVMAWVKTNAEHEELYDLFIGAEGGVKGQDCSWLFAGYYNVETIEFNNCFDTSKATDMGAMFYHCIKLKSLDAAQLKTGTVTKMGWMFSHCKRLTVLDVSGFDTSAVTNMQQMFVDCEGLVSLDVSGFDTSQVTTMKTMFGYCMNLSSLDVSGFDTSQVTDMMYMFYKCTSLTTLDVSNFAVGKDTAIDYMFYECGVTEEQAGLKTD